MSTTQKYLGLTIGPIYGTLQRARKTRQLWTASSLFSYLMERIVLHFDGPDGEKGFVIVPTLPESGLTAARHGTGLVPDRMIAASGGGGLAALEQAISQALRDVANMMRNTPRYPEPERPQEELVEELRAHYQTYTVEVDVAEGQNPVLVVNGYLDYMELQAQYNRAPAANGDFLDKYWLCSHHAAETKAAFGKSPESKAIHFRSLAEIGLHGLLHGKDAVGNAAKEVVKSWMAAEDAGGNANETHLLRRLKRDKAIKERFRTYHKYVAFVYADADNVGQTLGSLSAKQARDFSHCLLDFGQKAAGEVAAYGGLPIYIGGDDLLLVVPVATFLGGEEGPNHLFDLLERLRSTFDASMKPVVDIARRSVEEEKSGNKFVPPSLSFGVAITYYKHPMQEALEAAAHQLFEVAKFASFPGEKKKNALAIHLVKHSGSPRKLLLNQSGALYAQFRTAMGSVLAGKEKQLSSFAQKIRNDRVMVDALIRMGDPERIENYLENSFDEEVHRTAEVSKYLKSVGALLGAGDDGLAGQAFDCLELIHFLKRMDHD